MTAPLPPDADELVSAYLDGEAAPDEIAAVEANPELMARLEALRSVTEALTAPVDPPAPEVRSAHLSAALAAFDELVDAGEIEPTPAVAPVTSLAAARERRRPRRFSMVAAAAAAIAILFAGIVAVGLNRGTSQDVVGSLDDSVAATAQKDPADDGSASDEDFATQAVPEAAELAAEEEAASDGDDAAASSMMMADEESADAARAAPAPTLPPPSGDRAGDSADAADDSIAAEDEAATDSAEDDAGPAGITATEPADAEEGFAVEADTEVFAEPEPEEAFDLGVHDDLEALAAALADRFEGLEPFDEAERLSAQAPPTRCADTLGELIDGEQPMLLGLATLDERPVEVHVADEPLLYVLDRDDCRLVGEIVLESTGSPANGGS